MPELTDQQCGGCGQRGLTVRLNDDGSLYDAKCTLCDWAINRVEQESEDGTIIVPAIGKQENPEGNEE